MDLRKYWDPKYLGAVLLLILVLLQPRVLPVFGFIGLLWLVAANLAQEHEFVSEEEKSSRHEKGFYEDNDQDRGSPGDEGRLYLLS